MGSGPGGKMRLLFLLLVTAVAVLLLPPADAFVQATGPAAPRGRGGICAASRRYAAGAGALRMQQQDPRRRRMLRIAELRREIAQDVQRKSDELRDSYKITRDRLGGQLPPQQSQRDAKNAADAAIASAAAAAAAAAAASVSASVDKTGSNMAGATYLDRLSIQTTGSVDSGSSPQYTSGGEENKANTPVPSTPQMEATRSQAGVSMPLKITEAAGFGSDTSPRTESGDKDELSQAGPN